MVFSSFDFTEGCPEPSNSFHSSRTETLALLKSISVTLSWGFIRRGITTNSCILLPKKGPKYMKWTFCAIIYIYSILGLDLSQKEKTTLKVLVKNAKEKATGMQFPSLLLYFLATEMKLWIFYCDWTWEIKSCLSLTDKQNEGAWDGTQDSLACLQSDCQYCDFFRFHCLQVELSWVNTITQCLLVKRYGVT